MSNLEKKWYVLRAIGGKEKKAKEYIESEISRLNLQDYISQVLIPTEKVYQIRNGKKISKERNYFPGYVLVEAVLTGEIPHILRNIPNVIGFLGTQGEQQPIPLRESEVNRILGKVDELTASEEEITVPYFVGESVKVIDGPFNSFTGIIEEVNEEKKEIEGNGKDIWAKNTARTELYASRKRELINALQARQLYIQKCFLYNRQKRLQ